MFELTDTDIDIEALRHAHAHDASGGFVCFEGWVRNHNDGREVRGLQYEAYAPLALSEGNAIVSEALDKFNIRTARCQHRVGELAIGGVAVWVGTGSDHRDAAFRACRYIIDEIKARVPIWKKELYVSGDTQWIDCRDEETP
ncbi:MAG: molybdenum cofactor biosynthesis protein MoaE [Pseudomonadota bacterium]